MPPAMQNCPVRLFFIIEKLTPNYHLIFHLFFVPLRYDDTLTKEQSYGFSYTWGGVAPILEGVLIVIFGTNATK